MTESKMRTRMKILGALVTFMFAALSMRLWFLQVLASEGFTHAAQQNQVETVPIEPLRGRILDRNGTVLVDNRPSTMVVVNRLEMKGHEDEVIFRLSELLDIPVDELLERMASRRYLPYQPVPIAEDVSKEDVFYIREHPELFPGVDYQIGSVRIYPEEKLAAHLLGYVGEISAEQLEQDAFRDYDPGQIVGKGGVELSYERVLHGKPGIRRIQVNAQGEVLDENFGILPPQTGSSVVLSIDSEVQRLAETSLALGLDAAKGIFHEPTKENLRATGGAVVVMDPRNGQLLAMASNPTFDPSIYTDRLTEEEYEKLTAEGSNFPLINRGIQGLYPPGSTFKPFVAAGALRRSFAKMEDRIACPPEYVAPGDESGTKFRNWAPHDFGHLTIPESLVVSCDTVYYHFGWRYWQRYRDSSPDIEKKVGFMERDMHAMGFGRKTGVDLPSELAGVVPNRKYKEDLIERRPEIFRPDERRWLPGDYINMAIGQGFLLSTPLQVAVAYSALANGGTLLTPRLAWKVQTPDRRTLEVIEPKVVGKLPVSKKQVEFIRDALRGVVREPGTAAEAFEGFPLDTYPVAGKTGTADIEGKQPFSWFAAMAPADDPKYVVVAMIEQGGHGSETAAPVVRRVLQGLFGLPVSGEIKVGGAAD